MMMARQAVIMLLLLAQSGQNRKFLYLKISVKQSGAVEHSRSKINSEITSSLFYAVRTQLKEPLQLLPFSVFMA